MEYHSLMDRSMLFEHKDEEHIQAQGFQVWQSIVDRYTAPAVPPTNDKTVKLGENNSKAQNRKLSEIIPKKNKKNIVVQ
jgi:hypothetical protein